MPSITAKGRELAYKLNPAIGTTRAIMETCSLIARHATTHKGLMELVCNGGTYSDEYDVPDEWRNTRLAWAEKREAAIAQRIENLVADLPHTDDGPFRVEFQGDPRGVTVKIVAPGDWTRLYDDWGREGICVPQGPR